jgi:hypothetical protein
MVVRPTREELVQRLAVLEQRAAQREKPENQLRKSEEKYRLLIKTLPCTVFRGYQEREIAEAIRAVPDG